MKKTLILASLLIFATSMASFAATEKTVQTEQVPNVNSAKPYCKMPPPPKGPDFQKRNEEFEKRINLTDEQKAKAKELREQGFEKMKPIMEDMRAKQDELKALQNSKDVQDAQKFRKEMETYKQQLHEIRMQNMKEFESILTKKQQQELKKMKEEGRKNFEKNMKNRPEFKPGTGRPGFGPGHAEIPPQPPVETETK